MEAILLGINNNKKIYWMVLVFFVIVSVIVVAGSVSVQLLKQNTSSVLASSSQQKPNKNITFTVISNEFTKKNMGKSLVDSAIDKLRSNHPDLNINLKYIEIPQYNATRDQILKAITNGTHVDIITLDQIWLGDFAEKGLLTDLTNYTEKWGRLSDWYQLNLDGGVYKGKIYGIWAWTDVRGIWYWKDLLNKAGVDPNSLKTWNGYIESAKKLNSVLRPQGIEGVHLVGASHSPDLWYPYLWMLGGEIVQLREGHPTKGSYWFPAYNSSEGVKAMEFIKAQIDAGIKPQKKHYYGREFANRTFAVMIEGSWMPSSLPKQEFGNVGFIPMFPVPNNNTKTSTLSGGWEFSIPKTSSNKDLAWEIIKTMLEPPIFSPWIAPQGYLPTQITLGEGQNPYAEQLRKSIPFFDEMVSMIPVGRGRPSIPEYPAIAEDIRQALDEVYYGIKEPKQALDDAAAKSAKVLGW
jgi:multiple sugar transport system substrate-binding protein